MRKIKTLLLTAFLMLSLGNSLGAFAHAVSMEKMMNSSSLSSQTPPHTQKTAVSSSSANCDSFRNCCNESTNCYFEGFATEEEYAEFNTYTEVDLPIQRYEHTIQASPELKIPYLHSPPTLSPPEFFTERQLK